MTENQEAKAFVDQQLKIHSYMQSKRQPYESFWDELCSMYVPELYFRPKTEGNKGRRWGEDIWDGYPQLALHTWSKGLPGNMIYPDMLWLNMRINIRSLMDDDDVKKHCEKMTEQVFYAMRRTNFYAINPQFCRYAGAIGGYLFPMQDHKNRSLYFYLEDPWYVWIERDIFGNLTRAHREFQATRQGIADDFGAEKLHPTDQQLLAQQPYKEIDVLHCLFPNPDWDVNSLDATAKPYISCYIDKKNHHLIEQGGSDFLCIDWPVERHPRMAYGLTPSMFALTDAYGGDTLSHSLFRVAMTAADPPMRISAQLRHEYDDAPGGKTYITDPAQLIEEVRRTLQWPVSDEERQRLNAKLDWWFSVEYWRLLSSLKGEMPTAYHIQQLQSEKATLLGPQVSTYTRHVLDPAVDIVRQVENEYDPIPMPAVLEDYLIGQAYNELQRMGYESLTPEQVISYARKYPAALAESKYTGVLTSIQSQLVHARKYGEGLQAMQLITSMWPEARSIVNAYTLTRNILEASNWSAEDMVTKDEYKETVQQMQEREDLQQQAALENDASKAYRNLLKAPEQGSAVEMQKKQMNAA